MAETSSHLSLKATHTEEIDVEDSLKKLDFRESVVVVTVLGDDMHGFKLFVFNQHT